MCFKKILISALITLCITSCAYQPSISSNQPYCERNIFINKLTLKITQVEDMEMCENSDFGECIVALGIIGPLSFVVSGSIR